MKAVALLFTLRVGAACIGFWPSFLNVGNDLLGPCVLEGLSGCILYKHLYTNLSAKNAEEDFQKLGRGKAPKSKYHRSTPEETAAN